MGFQKKEGGQRIENERENTIKGNDKRYYDGKVRKNYPFEAMRHSS